MIDNNEAEACWSEAKEILKNNLGDPDFNAWINPIRFEYDSEANVANLIVSDHYYRSWIISRFLEDIGKAVTSTKLVDVTIKIEVDASVPADVALAPSASGIVPTIQKLSEDIASVAQKPHQLSLLPTTLCRTTFFRPINRALLRPSSQSYDQQPIETRWASLTWHGPDCGVKEEDVLIALIRRWVQARCQPFSCAYAELLDELKYKRSKQGKHRFNNYTSLKEHIDRISKISFMIRVKKGAGMSSGGRIHVLKYHWDDETKKLSIFIDPEFGASIARGYITGLEDRHLLDGDVAKALHRFISSHSMDGHYPLLDVAQAINLNFSAPDSIRRMLLKAVTELIKVGFLDKKSCVKKDILHWYRTSMSLSGPKLLEKIQEALPALPPPDICIE